MSVLTSRQRDILRTICEAGRPLSAAEIAGSLRLTTRQVNYCLRGIKTWLKHHQHELITTADARLRTSLSPAQARRLFAELDQHSGVNIVLSVSQRQQLLALFMLTQPAPVIVLKLEQLAQVSRMTLLKDLDKIEDWLAGRHVELVRKPRFGVQVSGREQACQQALAELLWSETPFSHDRVVEISLAEGLVFSLHRDAALLPLIKYADALLAGINRLRTLGLVAQAEEQLGGRFTDDAVLHLALTLAILAYRVQSGRHLDVDEALLHPLQALAVWPVAVFIAKRLGRGTRAAWKPADVAGIAMQMAAAPRSEILPGAPEDEGDFSALIESLMERISQAFEISKLKHDRTLRNGLVNNLGPACYRQRFQLWFPAALNAASLPEEPERETRLAQELAGVVHAHAGVSLPPGEINNLVVLLRAAYIRNRTYRFQRVIVVCPSGMATAQLLVARVRIRFPYLETLEVISLRDLTPALVAAADMILTTVPLPRPFANNPKAIHVHPLLLPEDVEALTQFLS